MNNELRHYEIVFLVHPDQSEQAPNIIQRYSSLITSNGGVIHRLEDWGRRQLAYPIKKNHRAHYILMNIECNETVLAELKHGFHFSENILRSLVLRRKVAITAPSSMMRSSEREKLKAPVSPSGKPRYAGAVRSGQLPLPQQSPKDEAVAASVVDAVEKSEEISGLQDDSNSTEAE